MISSTKAMPRVRQKLGKYRIEKRLGVGGFSSVFQAMDTIEGIRVAIKVPHRYLMNGRTIEEFRNEVRLTARLEHPNILGLKDASIVDGYFLIVTRLGQQTLDDRLRKRIAITTALQFSLQLLEAVAYAHRQRVIHCDIKPENIILLSNQRLCLTDFGIAKVAQRTVTGRGTGTVGYMAPEQAMGRPSARSDVFSLGLIIYRMFSGEWPEWPYKSLPALHRVRRKVHPDFIPFFRKCFEIDARKRFRDAEQMLNAFRVAQRKTLRLLAQRRSRAREP